MFEILAAVAGPPAEVLIDSTHVKAHRSAAAEKGDSSRPTFSACLTVKMEDADE